MIRTFNNSDIEIILDIWQNTNISAHHFISEIYWIDLRSTVKAMLPKADLFVMHHADSIVGFIGIQHQHIAGIFIKQAFQSFGYGKQLLDFTKERNTALTLSVYEKNDRAIQFYIREGFIEVSRTVDEACGEIEINMVWKQAFV